MTIEDIQKLITGDEHRELELKKSTGELKEGMHSACAFLNTDGGWLVFGITPKSLKIVGEQVSDSTRREISEAVSGLEPAVVVCTEYIDIPCRPDFKIIAMQFDGWIHGKRPYTFHGCPYWRVESTTRVMPRDVFEERICESSPLQYAWENRTTSEIGIVNLNTNCIYNAVRGGIRGGRMPESALNEPEEAILARWELLKDGKLVNAAVALFAGESNPFPQLSLRLARFKGTTMEEFIDSKWERGNVFELLDIGIAFCFKHLNLNGRIKGLLREEQLEIPVEALREALVNALCHRRYDNPGESIGLAIYDDRVEISNPGHLPPGVTPENIKTLHASRPSNPKMAQVLYKATCIENWGSGIQRMIEACVKQGLPEPEYNVWADGTIVIIFRKTSISQGEQTGEQKTWQRIISLMQKNPSISRREMAKILSKSESAIYKHIVRLNQKGIIRHVGPDFGGHWEVNQ